MHNQQPLTTEEKRAYRALARAARRVQELAAKRKTNNPRRQKKQTEPVKC